MKRPTVLILGPSLEAISGVSTHVKLLLSSPGLREDFALRHFQVGSEGRSESGPGRWLRLAASPFRLVAAIVSADAAIVHVNTSLNARAYWRDLAYVAVARMCGARVVYQVHGGALPQEFFGVRRLPEAFLRATLQWPDVVLVLAEVERAAYSAFVPRQATRLLPNGIDCAPYSRFARPARGPRAPLAIVFVGRLDREKGLYELLEAMHRLAGRGVAATLVIAGSGPEEVPLRERVRALGLEERVAFAGRVEGEDKARSLLAADVFALPSYKEGLPYALLEAMAAGAVPVASRTGAIPDVVEDGVHGLLVHEIEAQALAAALERLAADRAALERMSAACRARVAAEYAIERVAAELGTLYAALVGARAPKTAL